jgi:Uma2 family endonuclease
MDPARRLATYEDLRTLSEEVRAEVLDGAIISLEPPSGVHSFAQGDLYYRIRGPFQGDGGGPGGWWILLEADIRFDAHNIVRPDVAGWRRSRASAPWEQRPIEIIPDWIAEVLSESNAAHDRVRKRRLYAAHGVAFYWILDPRSRTLEALMLDPSTKRWTETGVYGDTDIARIPPFDAIELDVGRLFPPIET